MRKEECEKLILDLGTSQLPHGFTLSQQEAAEANKQAARHKPIHSPTHPCFCPLLPALVPRAKTPNFDGPLPAAGVPVTS